MTYSIIFKASALIKIVGASSLNNYQCNLLIVVKLENKDAGVINVLPILIMCYRCVTTCLNSLHKISKYDIMYYL